MSQSVLRWFFEQAQKTEWPLKDIDAFRKLEYIFLLDSLSQDMLKKID